MVLLIAALLLTALHLQKEKPVLTCGSYAMTNTQLGYYYWSEFFYYADAYGSWLGDAVDWTLPLDRQPYDAESSWQDYLLEETLAAATDTLSLVFRAQEEGFTLSDAQEADFDADWNDLLADADGDPQAYLRRSYGRRADTETYRQYLYDAHVAAAYADHLYESIRLTEADICAYAQQHGGEYLDAGLEEAQWQEQAAQDLLAETYENRIRTICNSYTFLVDYDAIVITPPRDLYQA